MIRLLAAMACAVLTLPAQQTTRLNVADLLGFERVQSGRPAGWMSHPAEHVSSDDQVFHDGQRSVRVERQTDSARDFSGVTLTIPVDFGGSRIELSGYVRTEEVKGFAAIWMRLDGGSGPLAFDSTQKLEVQGTTEWQQYTISVAVHPDGRNLYFGFLLVGPERPGPMTSVWWWMGSPSRRLPRSSAPKPFSKPTMSSTAAPS